MLFGITAPIVSDCAPIFFAAPKVTPFAFSIFIPPVPLQVAGNSIPVV